MVTRSRLKKKGSGKKVRRLPRTPVIKNEIFAVHEWETTTGNHHVYVWDKKGRMTTKMFDDWEDAEIYAQQQAVKRGIKKYRVDTPSRPHVDIEVPKHVKKYR